MHITRCQGLITCASTFALQAERSQCVSQVVSSNSNARDPVVSQVISSNSSATEEFIDKIRDRFRETHELLEQTQPFHPKTAQVSPVSVLTMAC